MSLYGQYRARNSTLPPRKNIFDLPFCFPYGDKNRTIGFLNAVWKCCSILFPPSLPPVALSQGDISYPISVSLCVAPPPTNNKDEDGKTAFLALAWGLFLRGSIWMGLRTFRRERRQAGKKVLVHFFKKASCFCPVFCLFSLRLLCSQVPPRQGRGKGKKLQWTFSFLRQRGMYTTQQSCTTVWGHKWIAASVPFVTDGTHKSPISESRKGGEEEERAMGRGEEDACLKRYYYTTYIPPPNKTLKGRAN